MKEPSIEEKAKRYDEAIKIAKEINNEQQAQPFNVMTRVFPELKESEDERIRKAIYNALKYLETEQSWDFLDNVDILDAYAWLEKQGEQKPADTDNKFIRMRETKPKDISEFLDRLTTVEQEFLWEHIEKVKKADREEQKPSDKVEPKFKKGQWVVWQNRYYKVNDNGCGYELIDQNGLTTSLEYGTVEESAHLWNIAKDAKDGDVLATEQIEWHHSPFVAIYKKQNEEDFDSYCFIGFDGKFYKGENGHSTEKVHPATKEQRDTLMKAMADAGYECNADKKELKKTEQTSAWSEEDKAMINNLYRVIDEQIVISGDTRRMFWSWLKSLKDRIVPQPKQEWSEEDERMFESVMWHLRNSVNNGDTEHLAGQLEIWFKSLKDKALLQPMQEWSEEDEKLFKKSLENLTELKDRFGEDYGRVGGCIDWLKSLRPRSYWKPSDEQMEALEHFIIHHNGSTNYAKDLEELRLQLKKLREE